MNEYKHINSYKTTVLYDKQSRETRVVYYKTAVVTFTDKQITLDTGGWPTRTTCQRMNAASKEFELGYLITRKSGKKNEWVVEYRDKEYPYTTQRLRISRKTGAVTALD